MTRFTDNASKYVSLTRSVNKIKITIFYSSIVFGFTSVYNLIK